MTCSQIVSVTRRFWQSGLTSLAKATHRSEKFYVEEALNHYLEDYVDAQIAKDRFGDPHSRLISGAELREKLRV